MESIKRLEGQSQKANSLEIRRQMRLTVNEEVNKQKRVTFSEELTIENGIGELVHSSSPEKRSVTFHEKVNLFGTGFLCRDGAFPTPHHWWMIRTLVGGRIQ
ncbi:MAG: hypothetical protein WBA22_10630 [Candidatus Methanofastidiosia archaeon]